MVRYLCLDCGEVYDETLLSNSRINEDELYCPKAFCLGQVVEVDDFLVSVIRNLSSMGFETLACCSGHINDNLYLTGKTIQTYILFKRELDGVHISNYFLKMLQDTLPDGFKMTISDEDFIIEKCKDMSNMHEQDVFIELAKSCGDLLVWTEEKLLNFVESFDLSWREGEVDFEDTDVVTIL